MSFRYRWGYFVNRRRVAKFVAPPPVPKTFRWLGMNDDHIVSMDGVYINHRSS